MNSWSTPEDGYNNTDYTLGLGEFDLQLNGEFINWGTYNTSHVYNYDYIGTGNTVNFIIFDGYSDVPTLIPSWYGDNSGSLNVDIYAQL